MGEPSARRGGHGKWASRRATVSQPTLLENSSARLPAVRTEQLGQLYAAHRLSLVRLAVLLVDDLHSAEDAVQDAFAGFAAAAPRRADPAFAPC